MYSKLWIYPFQISCLYKINNSVDVASVAENLFCASVSVVSELISHYPGLYIVGICTRRKTDKRHHGISSGPLEIKWGIGIYKAKRNLQLTIQDNVRSALKPLTRRYRTYFLSQRLRRLNCRFYIYTLFAKDKSIVVNTCAQIFTDGEFVQIITMRSKSEAGTTLDRINRDFGVANEIFMDNAPNQTGYNT